MKKRMLAMLLCVCTLLSFAGIASAENQTVSFYEGTGGFFYPFNEANHWTKSKLTLANQSMSSYLESDGINHSGMLEMKNAAGTGAISAGVSDITMEAGKNLNIRGKVRYANHENLVESHMYVALFITGLSGAPLYSDPECTVKTGEATGGFVTLNVSNDVNGASMGDGAWHTFSATFPVKGAKHSTGNYVDLTGKTVNIWFRPYAGNAFTATTKYFTQAYLDTCSENEITPYADVLLDDFEGYLGNKADKKTYTKDNHTIFFDFSGADAPDTKQFVGKNAARTYEETLEGKKGVVTVKNEVGSIVTHTYSVQGKENSKLRVSGDINLVNRDKLNTDSISVTAVLIYNGGSSNNPKGFYEDEACTIPFETVNGNAIGQDDSMLTGIGNGGWAHFSRDFDTTKVLKTSIKKKSSDSAKTTAYVKPWEVAQISVWLRITADGATASNVTASEKNFTAAYLTKCGYTKGADGKWTAGASSTKPYIHYALDNYSIESVPADTPSADTTHGETAYHKTATSLYYNFNGPSTADTTSFIAKQATRAYAESYAGKNGVVTLKDEATSVDTVYFDIKGEAGKKLKVAGDIAVMNNADVKEQNVNVNALLIMNGGTNNNPAGFYEDEACTVPLSSVNGNAICHQATMQKGIAQEGWTHYEYLFDTDAVFKSSIKRNASDSAKTTVYIKPWEVANIQVWMRIANGVAGNTTHTISENLFTADYLTACGYTKGEDGKWTAGASATNPFIQTAWDNLAIQNVSAEKTFSDFKVENITFSKTGKINIGDEITATFSVPEGFTAGKARVYLLADGETIGYALAENGTFTVPTTRDLHGKTLSVAIIPEDENGAFYEEREIAEIGTVEGSMQKLIAEKDDVDSVTWRYDVIGDVEESQVVVALYDKDNRLLSVTTTPVAAQTNADGVVASGSASHQKVQTAKVTVWNSLDAMKPLTDTKTVNFAEINSDPFADDREVNIVFVGDSTYANAGASTEQQGFVYQVGEWMKQAYAKEGRTINWYNTSYGGTTTDYTFVRFQRDVISKNPDMVIFAMTQNDTKATDTNRNVESCINMLNELENKPYMVMTFFTSKAWRVSPGHGEAFSAFYGIPFFDNTKAMEAAVASGTAVEDLYKDSVHPNDAGHKVIADALIEWIGTNRNFVRPAVKDEKIAANSGTVSAMEIFASKDISRVTRTGTWTEGTNYLATTQVGSTLEFDFSGDILTFETALHQYAGKIDVYIDGEYVWTDNPYYNMTGFQKTVRDGNSNFDLPKGNHHVVLKVVNGNNTATQMETRIYNIFAGSWK